MRSFRALIGIAAAAAVVALLILSQSSSFSFLGGVRAWVTSFTDRAFSYGELARLRTENEALRAERETLLKAGIAPFSYDLRKAPVHSRYPYAAQGLITIAVGSDSGVKEGMPVLAAPGALIGKVMRVSRTQSEVMTIFNPAWRSSARFEGSDIKALIAGGETPLLTLIPKGKEPKEHARVVSIDPAFPYGLFLGTAGVKESGSVEPWVSVPLEISYRESDLREVLVLVNFP